MRLNFAAMPSIRRRASDTTPRAPRALFAHAVFALMLLIGGAWSQQASATSGFCGVIQKAPASQSGATGSTLNYTFQVRDDGNCDLVGTVDNILITSDTTGGATITTPSPAQYNGLSNPSVPFSVKLGPSAGSVAISVNCQVSCDTFSSASYTATATAGTASMTPSISYTNTDNDGSGSVTPGDVLTFTDSTQNTGTLPLTAVGINETPGAPASKACGALAVGVTCSLVATYTVTAADAGTGSVSNIVTAFSRQTPTGFGTTVTVPVSPTPAPNMSISKVLFNNADGDGSGTVTPGDVLTYESTATNTGSVTLTTLTINDPLIKPNAHSCPSVPVDASCVLTGTYTVTAADASAGVINNTATATSIQTTSAFFTSSVSTPVSPTPAPAMSVSKVLTGTVDNDTSGTVTPGDQLNYSVTATNSGNVALTNVVVSDNHFAATNTCTPLAVGGTCVLTGSYIVTAGDAGTGSVTNIGSATSVQVPGPTTSTVNTPVFPTPAPAMTVAKTLFNNADGDGSGTVTQGDVLTYHVTATNTGNIPLTNVQVGDALTAPATTTCASVAVGATCVLSGTYMVTAADVAAGTINNTGTGRATQFPGIAFTSALSTRVGGSPAMTVVKTLFGNADGDDSGTVTPGDVLTFHVTANNTGNIPLTNVVVTDPKTMPNTTTCTSVGVGATCMLSGTYTVTAADVAVGNISNTGSATSTEVAGPLNSTVNTPVIGSPAMTVAKTLFNNADGDGSGTVTQGDVLTYHVTATNTGNIPLTNVQVGDALTAPATITCASVTVGATCVLSGTYTVTATDVTAGTINNTGTGRATQFPGIAFTSALSTPVVGSPAMTAVKLLANNADGDGSGTVTEGDVLTYTVTANNTGNIPLTNVVVTDPLTAPGTITCANVAVGANCVLSGIYTVTRADVKNAAIRNTGSATSTQVAGPLTSTLNTAVVGTPQMTVLKTMPRNADGDGSGTVTQGDVLTFKVSATNNGNIPLNNVVVTDPLTVPNTITCATVAIGATCDLLGTYTVTAADVGSGTISNTGSATATRIATITSTLNTPVSSSPLLSVSKTLTSNADADGSGTVSQGDVLTYTVTASNTGNVAMTNVQVTDPLTAPNTITCANVPVGANCVLVGTYTVTATDAGRHAINNTGSATSTQVTRAVNSTLRTPVVTSNPALTVAKVLTSNADGDSSGTITQGDVLTYTVTATNTGNVALTNMQVTDPLTTPNATTCASVALNATCVLTGTYTVTAADVTNGAISNTGSTVATQISTAVSKTLRTAVASSPAMTVAKALTSNADGDHSNTVTQGDVLTFTVTATNTGNIALTNLQVSDPLTAPNARSCANVAIGATCVLSGTYTVTAADVTTGSISNTGSATATQIGTPVNSTLNTPVASNPAMTVSKVLTSNADGDRSGTVTAGDVLTYTVTATNTGNIALTNVQVDDLLTAPSTKACANVTIGGTCVLGGNYTVTATDAANGSINNTGSATATQITTPVTSTLNTPVGSVIVTRAIAIETGDNQSGPPNTALPGDLEVAVTDNGSSANGVTVNWAVTSGTAMLSNPTSVVSGGIASINVNLGATPGPVTVTATRADDLTKFVTFHETITPVVATPALSLVSGNNQVGVVATHALNPLVVHLVDGSGVPFAAQTVTWQIVSGPAVLDNLSSVTDSSGNTQIGFSYGATTGAIVMRASFGASTVDFNASSQSYVITILGGNGQTAAPGQPLPQDFTVAVSFPSGMTTLAKGVHTQAAASLAGIPVQWNVLAGGGSLSQGNSTVTDTSGHSTNHYTLGSTVGLNQVQVAAPGGASVTFSATSAAAATATLQIVSGNTQSLTTNTPSAPLVVALTSNGMPVPNATITWSATNATLGSATSVTDSNGHASNTASVTNPGAATVSASSTAPAASPVTFGLNGGISHLIGLTPQQVEVANALDNACAALAALGSLTPAQQDLLEQCQALAFSAGEDPAQARNALTELFSNVAFLQTSAAMLVSTAQFDNIKARIAALRSGTGGSHFGGLAFTTPDGTLPVGSIGDTLLGFGDTKEKKKDEVGSDFSRWGFFASGTFGRGSADPRQVTPGYGFHTNGLTAGVDYRYSDKLIFGVSAGYSKYDSNVNAGRGGMNTHGWSLSAYSTFFRQDSWYLDGVFSYGNNSYDITRQIIYTLTNNNGTSTVNQTAASNSSGTTLAGALTFGRDFSKGPWSFGPYFRGTHTRINFGDYQEVLQGNAPGSGLGLSVQTRDLKSTASVLGAKVNYASSQSWGVLMPHAEIEWEHEFQSSPDSITAHFLQDPTATPIQVSGDAIDTDFFRLGLGMSFVLAHGRSGFIYYEKTLGRTGITQDNLAIGLRLEF